MPVIRIVRLVLAVDDGEIAEREVDVRRAHLDADASVGLADLAALVDVLGDLLGRAGLEREHRGHVVHGEIRFEKRGLVGDDGVPGRVRFVEAVARELQDQTRTVHYACCGGAAPSCRSAFNELVARGVGIDDLHLLLADRLDERVRLAERNVAQLVDDEHHLLLVDHDAVGFLGVLRSTIGVHLRHGRRGHACGCCSPESTPSAPGRIQRIGGNEIFEAVRLHAHQQASACLRIQIGTRRRFRPGGRGRGRSGL